MCFINKIGCNSNKEITSRLKESMGRQDYEQLVSIKMLVFYYVNSVGTPKSIRIKHLFIFICPITSIFLGIEILKLTFTTPGSMGRKIAYTIFGCIATLGLGMIFIALQILTMIFTKVTTKLFLLSQKYNCCDTLAQSLHNIANSVYPT